jgi:hypothetical protein
VDTSRPGFLFGTSLLLFIDGHCGGNSNGVFAMTDNEAQQIAHGLIQGYLGPDHKVIDMQSFYRALVEALLKAHHQGWQECAALGDA